MNHRAAPTAIAAPTSLARRHMLLGAGLVAGFATLGVFGTPAEAQAALSAEDRAVVQQAQTYLQGLTSAQGAFVETGPNNVRREGRAARHARHAVDADALIQTDVAGQKDRQGCAAQRHLLEILQPWCSRPRPICRA